jgi:hypothetical protein
VLRRAVSRRPGEAAQLRRDLEHPVEPAGGRRGGLRVLTTALSDDRDYAAAIARGQGPVELAPDGLAATECRALWQELAALAIAPATSATATGRPSPRM